ncbi:hypothetical protein [Hymenobacter metallicola]|uniref:Uncharacterized protein n=1 Tax=Hymenobacter metallicola TaxID=2563114 RepID=A0A4Z0QIT5_9BACT|nr:hypothetical protein [Hymenobacter metallicola]TGE29625.1 hypothetical protein E5K02_09275 [Hymenobacter metallicola]
MLRNLFTWFLLLGAALTVAACCVNNECDCRDNTDDAVYLKFSLADSANAGPGFVYEELRRIYIRRQPVRSTNEIGTLPGPDSVLLTRTRAQLRDSLLLSPSSPFTSSGRRFDAYQYTIRIANPKKAQAQTNRFVLANISVQGAFDEASACCTCYRNTVKTFDLIKPIASPTGGPRLETTRYDFSGQPVRTVVLKR